MPRRTWLPPRDGRIRACRGGVEPAIDTGATWAIALWTTVLNSGDGAMEGSCVGEWTPGDIGVHTGRVQ